MWTEFEPMSIAARRATSGEAATGAWASLVAGKVRGWTATVGIELTRPF
jgi:hypothetical protein